MCIILKLWRQADTYSTEKQQYTPEYKGTDDFYGLQYSFIHNSDEKDDQCVIKGKSVCFVL